MESLINMDGISDVANNLIDKVSGAIGWVATHETPKRAAVSTYIQEIQKSDYDPITKAALISQAKKSIREYSNQKNVLEIASRSLLSNARPDALDEDWVAQFMDKVRLVSTQEFQMLWGSILAQECNAPGSIPKSLLHIMEQMDRDMANTFMAVASISIWHIDQGKQVWTPVIIGPVLDDYYKALGITYDALVNLQSVGLINMEFGLAESAYVQTRDAVCSDDIHYHDKVYSLTAGQSEFPVGNVIYTGAGNSLCHAIVPSKVEHFFEEKCIPLWNKFFGKE
ncbi:MAG: DUF2806 domain-containing protein [Oscillospiraceae bacterium]|nr:DUF2806 domain-containing protein [Oscillospiraceae bacterium]